MKRILCITGFIILATQFLYGRGKDTVTNAGLILPAGFKASIIATGIDGARHITVTKQGGIYVKLAWLKNGKGIWYLKDTNGDGIFDAQSGFGNFPGTGICIKNGWLYASSNSGIFRYKLNDKGEVVNTTQPEKIVTGLVDHNRDNAKAITIDNDANLYVEVGSYENACVEDKQLKGPQPCGLLDSAGGIWKFQTNKANQTIKDATHYATGLKNVVGLAWNNQTNSLFVVQHGRDMTYAKFPQYYTAEQNGLLPAETMYELHKGSDCGWPYVYYDPFQHKRILAPEYGGDGKKTGDIKAQEPLEVFPAHLAPDGLLFYTGNTFPAKYKNGAFIAFHGSSPQLNEGYLIAFVPFKNGKPSGKWEIFANGFAGKDYNAAKGAPKHKPCGLAQGPDGAIYVADDTGGAIYKIQYGK